MLTYLLNCNNNLRSWCYGYMPQTNTIAGKKRGITGTLAIEGRDDTDKQLHMRDLAAEQLRELLSPTSLATLQGKIVFADSDGTFFFSLPQPTPTGEGPFLFGPEPTLADLVLYEHAGLCRCVNAQVRERNNNDILI